jgi:1,4-alpha-glucan branching enzyme
MSSNKAYMNLVLHAHFPFVRHPEYDDFLEEDWFFEGMTESYVPLLIRFEKMRAEGVPYKLTMSISPSLAAMMKDPHLLSRLYRYLDRRRDLLKLEIETNKKSKRCAERYLEETQDVKEYLFRRFEGDITRGFVGLEKSGHLELITCTASHAFLPLIVDPEAQRLQILTAVKHHEHYFGKKPKGIWLAECGYSDGVDRVLADCGIEFFYLDTHGLTFADPSPVYGVYAPVVTSHGVTAFGRDPETSHQVWSRRHGYPGDPHYRELYRDLGFDAAYEYIKPYLHSDAERRAVGIKYHKITGDVALGDKELYDPVLAAEKAAEHAAHFVENRRIQARELKESLKIAPIITSPYDAELFGHWWYEGPIFLEMLIRKMAFDQNELELTTALDYMEKYPVRQKVEPNPSSWGEGGSNQVWLNGANAWMYSHQHHAQDRTQELVQKNFHAQGEKKRALNQLVRELLLLQSSDWAFIITTRTTIPYATRRFREHLDRFNTLADQIEENAIDSEFLEQLEKKDIIFPVIDFRDAIVKNDTKNRYVFEREEIGKLTKPG